MDDGVGISTTPVADMANGESLQMLVRQKHSKEGNSATNSVGNTTRGRASLGLRPWQQPVPLPPSTLDSLVRSKSLAGSPHGAGFGEISASQEETVLTKDKEEGGVFDMEKIIVEDEGYGSRDDRSEEKKSSFWQDLWSSPSAQLKRLVRTPWKGGIPPFWVDSNVQGTPSRGRGIPSRGRGGRGSKAKRGRGVPRGKPAKHGGLWGAISQIRKSDEAIKESQITKGWSMAYNMVVTGHSGRRTGALNYIRMGWAIPQVAYLGRWKSDVIYNYAQEALQCRPVNEAPILEKAIANAPPPRDESGEIIAEVKDQYVKLQVEVEEFKRDSRKAILSLSSEVEDLAKNYGSPAETPPYVQSMASKVIHQNLTPVTCTPPILWRTRCGWQFKDGNFCFVASSLQVTCAKCLVYMDAQTQGGVNGIL